MSGVRVRQTEARRRAEIRTPVRHWVSLLRVLLVPGALLGAGVWVVGCERRPAPSADAAAPSASAQLSPELAAKVLARVGAREITLGEFAGVLERMDPLERVRYQSPERRRKLLEELVDAELLAAEARRRGLDASPETEARVRAVLRDELLARVRRGVPGPEAIPEREVRAYYDAHREELRSPERRRVSIIVMDDPVKAREVLQKVRAGGARSWGDLVKAHSLAAGSRQIGAEAPELAGDVGFVTAPEEPKRDAAKVPDAVRRAAFAIEQLGDVHPEVVEADGKRYIVKITSKSAAGLRSYADAERSIRTQLAEARLKAAEEAFERELAARYPLKIDEAALSRLEVGKLEVSPRPAESAERDAGGG